MTASPTASADLLQRILDASPNGVLFYEAVRDGTGPATDLRLAVINARARQVVGQPTADLIGQMVGQLFPEAIGTERLLNTIAVADTGQRYEYYLHTVPPAGGELRWFDVTAEKINNGVLVTFTDSTDRRRAERQLRAQADTFAGVLRAISNSLIVFAILRDNTGQLTDLRYEYVSDSVQRDTGLERDQLIGKTLLGLFPQAVSSKLWQACQVVATTGVGQQYEDQYAFEGIENQLLAQVTAIDKDRIVAIYQITNDLKWAQQEAERQARLLQTVVNNAPVGIILAEAIFGTGPDAGTVVDFRYRLTNTLNATLSGHPVEAMNGQLISTLFPGWQGIALFAAMKTVVERGEPVAFAEEYDNFGIRGWFDYRLVKQDKGVLLTFLDVTKLKQAERQRLQQADLLQTVVNNTPTGIVLYAAVRDASGTIVDFLHTLSNPVNTGVTGRSADELIGLSLLEHYPTNRENGHFDALVRVTETGQPVRRLIEYRAHGIDGWFDAYYVRQNDGVLFTYLDVTESQQYRRQLETANLELTRSNENLQQFAYVASHDLQEPLRKIQAFGDLLIDRHGAGLGDQGVDMLRRMQSAASRMSGLIRDLLAYSRLTTQREPFQPVLLPALLDRLLEDLDLSIRESGATITVGPLPTVAGDPAQLHQLFLNLLTNALKFRPTDETGQFVNPVVTVESLPVNVVDLPAGVLMPGLADASADRWFHQISVTDNGIGFDEKYLDRVFQVFQRLHGKQQYAGSGVGLAICKRVVENHGGAITATSQPNQGSTFLVYLKSEE